MCIHAWKVRRPDQGDTEAKKPIAELSIFIKESILSPIKGLVWRVYCKSREQYSMIINVSEAKAGMVLQRDLVHDGKVLLKAHSTLSDAMISVLKIRNILHIDVEELDRRVAPGADVYYRMAVDTEADAGYMREKNAVNELFSTVKDDDQMLTLKYCIVRQIEEKHGDQA